MRTNYILVAVLFLFAIGTVTARTISIYGDFQDGFLKTALPDAKVALLRADSTVFIDSLKLYAISTVGEQGDFIRYVADVPVEKATYLVRIKHDGYDEELQKVVIDNPEKSQVEVPMISMFRKHTVDLDEVTVKATRVKMFWRGDTIVYDATAFNMPDGSMLDNLIRQLPGAEIKENGEIFVNGRKIDELLLGSRSFMGGKSNVLMQNLPYYTVKNLKVYEKTSDMSEALGFDTGTKSFVMDVNLKKEYQMGLVGNVEAAGGTERRWLGRAFLLGFTDRWRYTLLANANNVNETRHAGETGYWTPSTMPQNMTTVRDISAEADYRSASRNVSNTLTAEYSHITTSTEMNTRRETFLSGMTPLSTTESLDLNKSYRISVKDNLTILKPFYLNAGGSIYREKTNRRYSSDFSQWGDTLTARMRTAAFDKNTVTTGLISVDATKTIDKDRKQYLRGYIHALHYNLSADNEARYCTEQYSVRSDINNLDNILNRVNELGVEANYGQSIARAWDLRAKVSYNMRDTKAHDYLHHPDSITLPSQLYALPASLDFNNSYRYQYTKHTETLSLTFANSLITQLMPGMRMSSEQFSLTLDIPLMQQRLDYQRGTVDTVAVHNSLRINPGARFKRKFGPDNRNELTATAAFTTHDLDLLQTISYRDDSRPLVVTEGNDHLKARQTSTWSIDYANHNGPGRQEIAFSTKLDYSHRDVAQSVTYDAMTGVYTYRPVNVGGSYLWSNTFLYSRNLDRKRLWWLRNSASAELNHSVDQTMLSGAAASTINRVNTWTVGDRLYVQFAKGSFLIGATGDVKWRRSTGKMVDFHKLSAVDFQYGLSGSYTVPVLNTTISADGNMYSRRGYGSSSLNTNDFVLNASISQSMINGRLVARVEGFDVLHQLSQVKYEVNAQGRVETWCRTLPHYVMLHLIYQFNINPKKK